MESTAPASCPVHSGGSGELPEEFSSLIGEVTTPDEGLAINGTVRTGDISLLEEMSLALSERIPADQAAKTGILLVSHGSRSPAWRRLLLDVHREASDDLLAIEGIGAVRTAFMEYTEPSIATQLRAFDDDGYESVIVVPLLLTISIRSQDLPHARKSWVFRTHSRTRSLSRSRRRVALCAPTAAVPGRTRSARPPCSTV